MRAIEVATRRVFGWRASDRTDADVSVESWRGQPDGSLETGLNWCSRHVHARNDAATLGRQGTQEGFGPCEETPGARLGATAQPRSGDPGDEGRRSPPSASRTRGPAGCWPATGAPAGRCRH